MVRHDDAAIREETAHHEVHRASGKKIRVKYDSPDFVIVVPSFENTCRGWERRGTPHPSYPRKRVSRL